MAAIQTSVMPVAGFPREAADILQHGVGAYGALDSAEQERLRQRDTLSLQRVVIPDLFVSFMAQTPKPNPYYDVVKKESETWMKKYVLVPTF